MYAIGTHGSYHYDGLTWSEIDTNTDASLYGIWGTGPADVYAVGTFGTIVHFDGFTWSRIDAGTGDDLYDVWGDGADVFVVGDAGTIIHVPRSCAAAETHCDADRDEDCDGLRGCADPDCSAAPYCAAGGACAAAVAVGCNVSVAGTTDDGPSNLLRYGCSPWLEPSTERSYLVGPLSASGTATVSIDGLATDLDLFALEMTASGACDPTLSGCLGASSTSATTESISFAVVAGQRYYVVVDGQGVSAGAFQLDISCP